MLLLHLTGSLCVSLLPAGLTSPLRGPDTVRGFVGRSIPVTCDYDEGYLTYFKYWCKGDSWDYCTEVVKTRGSEAEVKAGRTSIQDNHTCSCFTVTLENLSEEDAGVYWCGIEKALTDPSAQVTIVPAAKARGHSLQSTVPSCAEGNVSNANVRAKYKTPSPSSDQDRNSTLHVEYTSVKRTPAPSTQPQPVPGANTEDVSYATINFPAHDEQAIYANLK